LKQQEVAIRHSIALMKLNRGEETRSVFLRGLKELRVRKYRKMTPEGIAELQG
jgi:hypothetical protein